MSTTLLLRPEVDQHVYRLSCRFTVSAPIGGVKTDAWLNSALKEKLWAGNRFIAAMEKEGWTYLGKGLDFTAGPLPHVDPTRGMPARTPNIPKRRRGEPSPALHKVDPADYAYYVQKMDPIRATEKWDYELTGEFTKAVLTEYVEISNG